jgi:hypothetical protein
MAKFLNDIIVDGKGNFSDDVTVDGTIYGDNLGLGVSTAYHKLHIADGNILMQGGGETAFILKRDVTFSSAHTNAPFVNPIFQIGRIIQGGDGAPQFRWLYSDDSTAETVVMELDSEGIMSSVRQERGSHFEGHIEGEANPFFRINSYPDIRLELGPGGGSTTDVSMSRSTSGNLNLNVGSGGSEVSIVEVSSTGIDVSGGANFTGLVDLENSGETTLRFNNTTGNIYSRILVNSTATYFQAGDIGGGSGTTGGDLWFTGYKGGDLKNLIVKSAESEFRGNATFSGLVDIQSTLSSGTGTWLNIGLNSVNPVRAKIYGETYNANFSLYNSGNLETVKISSNGDSFFNGGNVSFSGVINMKYGSGITGSSTGAANSSYLEFNESNGTTRQGFIGFASGSNNGLFLKNEVSNKILELNQDGVLDYNGDATFSGSVNVNSIDSKIGFAVSDTFGDSIAHYGMTSKTTDGLYLSGFYGLKFATSGLERLIIDGSGDATFSGNVEVANTSGGILNLKSTDTSLVTDQLIGGITFEKLDPSGEGVGIAGSMKMISNSSIGAAVRLELAAGIGDGPNLILYENSSEFLSDVYVNGIINLGDSENLLYKANTSIINGTVTNTTTLKGRQVDIYSYDSINLRSGTNTADSMNFYSGSQKSLTIDSEAKATFSNQVHINGEIISSVASLQVNGFQRTGSIYLHEGGNTPTTANAILSNELGVLNWDGNPLLTATALDQYVETSDEQRNLDTFWDITKFGMTSEEIRKALNKTSSYITAVDDPTAPEGGCFEVSNYITLNAANYWKIDTDATYHFEVWVKVMSSTETNHLFYAGWSAYDSNKTYFGNVNRYWGASGESFDSNSNNDGLWHKVTGRIGPGQFTAGTEYARPLLLLNYSSSGTVTRYCGLKMYRSEEKKVSTITQVSSSAFNGTVDGGLKTILDKDSNLYVNEGAFSGDVEVVKDSPLLHLKALSESIAEIRLSDNEATTTQFGSIQYDSNSHTEGLKFYVNNESASVFELTNTKATFSGDVEVDGIGKYKGASSSKYLNISGGSTGNFIDTYGNDLFIRYGGSSSKSIRLGSDGKATFSGSVKMGNASGITGGSTGTANTSYLGFFESNGTTRQGYVGFGSNSNTTLYLANQMSGKSLELQQNGVLFYNGNAAFSGSVSASNLSGTNTGDQDLSTYWSQASLGLEGGKRISTVTDFNADLPSGFYQSSSNSNAPGTGYYNMLNVRHSNSSNQHGFQMAASYYDNHVYTRTYSGGSSGSTGSFRTWAKQYSDANFIAGTDYAIATHEHYKLLAGGGITTQAGAGTLIHTAQVNLGTTGLFPASDNANSIITVNRHPGDYYSQLGFSSNGRMYYRKYANQAISANVSEAWQTVLTDANIGSVTGGYAKLSGGNMLSGNNEFYSTNTSGSYDTAAIEIREVGLVTNTQSADEYAPSIGFHWGGLYGNKLFMDAGGVLNWTSGSDTGAKKDIHIGGGTFEGTVTMANQKAFVASNCGHGVYGLYNSYKYQHLWSMGTGYNLSADGTTPGNLYGIAWTHNNAGGESKDGLSHQALFMKNGVTQSAVGTGIWTLGTITSINSVGLKVNSGSASRIEIESTGDNWAYTRLKDDGNVSWDIGAKNGGALEFRQAGSSTNKVLINTDASLSFSAKTNGYFFSDTAGRTAFKGGDFYIQSDVNNCYLYANNTYLGGPSGDQILFRGNTVTADNWGITSAGVITGDRVVTRNINTSTSQELVLNAGEAYNYATGQTVENIYLNAEGGVRIISSPDNWATGWAGRNELELGLPNGSSSFPGDISTPGDINFVSGKGFVNSGSWTRNETPYGYIEFGPANSGHAHIYTDRATFYFNKSLLVNGVTLTGAPTGGEGITVSSNEVSVTNANIPGGVDLNTYRTTGFYVQTSNSNAASGSNWPIALAGILEVYNKGIFTVQRYKRYNAASDYSRAYYNGTWTAWTDLSLSGNTITDNNQIANGRGYTTSFGSTFTPVLKYAHNGATVSGVSYACNYTGVSNSSGVGTITINCILSNIPIGSNPLNGGSGFYLDLPSSVHPMYTSIIPVSGDMDGYADQYVHGKLSPTTGQIIIPLNSNECESMIITGTYVPNPLL